MQLSILLPLFLFAAVLASPTNPKQVSRTVAKRGLKQATRDGIVSRARNPFRRQAATSCGTCPDCCPGYCRMSGQVDHAAYFNTDLPTGYTRNSVAGTSQTSLEACIMTCCINPSTCNLVRYDATLSAGSTNCEQYYDNFGTKSYPTTDTPGVTVVANTISCADNAGNAGGRPCCNAPLMVA